MKRGLTVGAAVLAVLLLGLPWLLGARTQIVYETALTRLQEQGLPILDNGYRRGWFASEASFQIQMPRLSRQSTGPVASQFRVVSQIAHGPWSLRSPRLLPSAALVDTRVELPSPGSESPILLVRTHLALDGSGTSTIRLPQVTHSEEGAGLQLIRSEGELEFTARFATIAGRIELPALSLSTPDGIRVNLQDLRAQGNGSHWLDGLYTGDGILDLGHAELQAPQLSLIAGGFSARGKSIPENGLLSMELDYSVEDLRLNGFAFGPAQISFSMRRLPGEALASLQKSMRQVTAADPDESLARLARAAILARHLPLLLAADPALALERIYIGTPEGMIQGHLSFATQGLTSQALQHPDGWLDHLVAEGKLSLPRPFLLRLLEDWQRREVQQELSLQEPATSAAPEELEAEIAVAARDRLASLVRQGWLAEADGNLKASARLGDSLLTVNGKTIPISSATH